MFKIHKNNHRIQLNAVVYYSFDKRETCKVCGEEKREILAVLPSQNDELSITTTIIIVVAIACVGTVGSIAIIKKKK